ncbi:MAG: sodium extrusion protein NatB [Pirellulaceae bacterium]|nr:MAG: sodium extrusion protein NatB [Pirellulaceae bacterium]
MSPVKPLSFLRMCLKEHRESLRDRRTIVTLVLMPLLVYPLLSLLLNRALLMSFADVDRVDVTFGIAAELKDSHVATLLSIGWGLAQQEEAPIRIAEPSVPRQRRQFSLPSLIGSGRGSPQLVFLEDDGRAALRAASVDLVLRRKVDGEDDQGGNHQFRSLAELIEPYLDAAGAQAMGVDVEAVLNVFGTYEVQYRQGDRQSERALLTLQQIVAALNQEVAVTLLGSRFVTPVRIAAQPVVAPGRYVDLLATMVPLVLVLMTMAGAVYPAIDLTAGERERGTMEALVIAPTPSWVILMAKYTAVVSVALLTALANLAAMTLTLWVSGIGEMIFGQQVLTPGIVGTVLVLLILFTMFFAALLLAITSFAKSFKEAQAYLIPVTLLALTPGVMSLLPGIRFTPLLATVPLVNIVLLAREILTGEAQWNAALLAVICTCVYAIAALAVASRLFGSKAAYSGSQGSWSDLWVRPTKRRDLPTVDQMAMTMAVMFPLYFVASSLLPHFAHDVVPRLLYSAAISYLLFFALPAAVCWYRRIDLSKTFLLRLGDPRHWFPWCAAIVLLAASMWIAAHELMVIADRWNLAPIPQGHMEQAAELSEQLMTLPLFLTLVTIALTPAVCEEWLFRGFVMSALRPRPWMAIVIAALAFGLMHVLTSNVLAIERFLPTTFIGLILGYVAWKTNALWTSTLLHMLHNGLLLMAAKYRETLSEWGLLAGANEHFPVSWLIASATGLIVGVLLIHRSCQPHSSEHSERNAIVSPPPELPAAGVERP